MLKKFYVPPEDMPTQVMIGWPIFPQPLHRARWFAALQDACSHSISGQWSEL
jgi:hypothetical protein